MKSKKDKKPTSDAMKILSADYGKNQRMKKLVSGAYLNAKVAQLIYKARTDAELTQQQLADLVGTTQPVIARLEDANYSGHSLTMLQKIAAVLNKKIEINLVSTKKAA